MNTKETTVMYYMELLEKSFINETGGEGSRLLYVANRIYGIHTGLEEEDLFFAKNVTDIIHGIRTENLNGYLTKNKTNYRWFLALMHIPFLSDKVEWNSDIYNGWFSQGTHEIVIGYDEVLVVRHPPNGPSPFLSLMQAITRFANKE